MEIEELRAKILEEISKLPEEQAQELREKIADMDEQELLEFIKQSSSTQCLFCQIVAGKIETVRVYESANIFAILDINPASLGHTIVMPKQHFQFITQLPQELLYELFSFVKYLSPVLLQVLKAQGIDVYIAQGISQRVPHLAINIIPRFKDDKINLFGERKKVSKDELEKIAASIKKAVAPASKEGKEQASKKKIEINKSPKPARSEELKKSPPEQGEQGKSKEERDIEAMMKFRKGRTP